MLIRAVFVKVPSTKRSHAIYSQELDTSSGITNATQRLVTIGEGPDSESSGEVEVGTWGAVNPTFSSEVVTGRDGIPAAEA